MDFLNAIILLLNYIFVPALAYGSQLAIGTLTATDPEGDDFTFSIDSNEINVDSASGVLTFVAAPDYEAQNTYTAVVTATDTEANSATQNITVNIINLNDNTPVITSTNSFKIICFT